MKSIETLLKQKGFKEVAENGYMKVLVGDALKEYFSADADYLPKVEGGEIEQIELFIYPSAEYAEWRVDENDVCTPDYYEGVLEFVKTL